MDSRDDNEAKDAAFIVEVAKRLKWSEKRLKAALKKLLETIRHRDEAKRKPLH